LKAAFTANPAGESNSEALKLDFDRRLILQFQGSVVASDAGLLAHRELDDALGLGAMAGEVLADARTGKNGRHALVGMLRPSGESRFEPDAPSLSPRRRRTCVFARWRRSHEPRAAHVLRPKRARGNDNTEAFGYIHGSSRVT
jgi:hypothetical protein